MSLIELRNVCFGYGRKKILENINLTIEPKDYILIVGENGSGKTSLLKCILGEISPTKGVIRGAREYTSKIGYIPQLKEIEVNFPASVYEIVLSGRIGYKGKNIRYSYLDKNHVIENAEKLKILNLLETPYKNLSGGQKQRVLLARAMCAKDEILILDEPTTGLDIEMKRSLYDILKKINDEGTTIILVSHENLDEFKDINKIIYIEDKTIREVRVD